MTLPSPPSCRYPTLQLCFGLMPSIGPHCSPWSFSLSTYSQLSKGFSFIGLCLFSAPNLAMISHYSGKNQSPLHGQNDHDWAFFCGLVSLVFPHLAHWTLYWQSHVQNLGEFSKSQLTHTRGLHSVCTKSFSIVQFLMSNKESQINTTLSFLFFSTPKLNLSLL